MAIENSLKPSDKGIYVRAYYDSMLIAVTRLGSKLWWLMKISDFLEPVIYLILA